MIIHHYLNQCITKLSFTLHLITEKQIKTVLDHGIVHIHKGEHETSGRHKVQVVKLLTEKSMVSCIGNLYKSVDEIFFSEGQVSLCLINKFNVKEVGALQEKVVQLGMNEGLRLLKASLQSKSVDKRLPQEYGHIKIFN
ncbi:hypothetical protein Ahy_B09g099571 [Arachis hypogaea]|uniref:Uncharacterized protein n=1 Tax=Arachis hypogaea TaxID=3818 RepID=A0A444XUA2_ARAHY|nr:hypothetical protein Ahy_B09g099571 [Arachis hypogaea]